MTPCGGVSLRLFGPIVLVLSVALGAGGIAYQTRACSSGGCSVASQASDNGQCTEQAPPVSQRVATRTPPVRQQRGRAPTLIVPLNATGYNYRKVGTAEPELFTGAEPAPALRVAPEAP